MDLKLTDSSAANVGGKDCEICWTRKGNYTCPRCNVAYCGLDCYRHPEKHLACSELFYKEQVVGELKSQRLDESAAHPEFLKENRRKMVEILKRSAKGLEFDPELDESEMLQSLEELVKQMGQNGLAGGDGDGEEDELEEEIDQEEVNELLKKIVNRNLIRHAAAINTSNASPNLYFDVLQTAFVYAFLASIHDVDGESLNRAAHETRLGADFVANWLEIQQSFGNLSRASRTPSASLSEKLRLTIQILSTDELDPAHRNYLNKKFFGELIDDLSLFVRHPSNFLVKIVSFLYGQLEMRLAVLKQRALEAPSVTAAPEIAAPSSEEPKLAEKPINVFHLNRQTQAPRKETSESKSRVKIIRKPANNEEPMPETPEKPARVIKSSPESIQEVKAALRRLEFYFKWLSANKSTVESPELKAKLQRELDELKTSLANETSQFEEERRFVEKNLDLIKAKQKESSAKPASKLIEEL